jgi:hypothetical protein
MGPAIDEPLTLNEVTATGEAIEPTDDLGLVQLVQKLASTLEARRDQIATQAAAVQASANVSPVMAAAELVASEAFEAAPADEAMEAMAAYFGRPAEIEPDAFAQPAPVPSFGAGLLARHFESEEDEDSDNSDFAAGFSLPLATNIFASEPELSTEEAVGDEASGEDDEPEYGSLLGMRNPFLGKTEEFVRIEEPAPLDDDILPEVVFPTAQPTAARTSMARPFDAPAGKTPSVEPQARATPTVEADDALRRALETLQRMSSNG